MNGPARCHPGLVRAYRERRGWTQVQLAVRAGFSERLVRKAESGEAVRMETVDILAQALSTDAERLSGRDLIDDPLAVAQSFVRAYLTHGIDGARLSAHLLDPNIVMAIHSDPTNLQFAGEFFGIDGIEHVIRTAYVQFTVVSENFGKWFTNGPKVAALRQQVLRANGVPNSPELQTWILHEYTVEGGRILRVDTYLDAGVYLRLLHFATAEATRAAEQLPTPLKALG